MHKKALPYLASPCCRVDLVVSGTEKEGVHFPEELYEGRLGCSSCGASYRVSKGVPVLMRPLPPDGNDEDRVVRKNKGVFDYLWSRAEKLPLDDFRREEKFLEDVRIERDFFQGASVLETGIGEGRFLPFLLDRRPAALFGADISDSVFGVYNTFAPRAGDTRLCLVQADPRFLPFKPGVFDVVLSVRTLHQTPAPSRRLSDLVRLLRPGGRLSCSVFAQNGRPGSDRLRGFVGRIKVALKRCPLERLYRWTFLPALAVSLVIHGAYPVLTRIPSVGKHLPFRRVAAQWARFRFPSLRLFVVFDLLAVEITWFVSEAELRHLLSQMPVSRFEYVLQHEALWMIHMVK